MFQRFSEVFRGPLRDPLRGRFPRRGSQSCCPSACCPLSFLEQEKDNKLKLFVAKERPIRHPSFFFQRKILRKSPWVCGFGALCQEMRDIHLIKRLQKGCLGWGAKRFLLKKSFRALSFL